MSDESRLFQDSRANPHVFGGSLRASSDNLLEPECLERAAKLIRRPVSSVDPDGYECRIIGAATNAAGDVASVHSRSQRTGIGRFGSFHVDITIRVHLHDRRLGMLASADIKTYNPYSGCDVWFFQWIGRSVVLIYREKHNTYACRYGDIWPPKFVEIEESWVIHENCLAFVGYKEETVRRLSFPELDELEPLSMDAAAQRGLIPEAPR